MGVRFSLSASLHTRDAKDIVIVFIAVIHPLCIPESESEREINLLNHKRVNVCAVQFNSHILKYIEALTRIDDGISDACKVLILRYQPSIDHTAHMLHDRGEDSFVRSFVLRSRVAI